MEILQSSRCPICDASSGGTLRFRTSGLSLFDCGACRSWVARPRPDPTLHLAAHDEDAYFRENPYFLKTRALDAKDELRFRRITDFIGSHVDLREMSGRRVLDIGCDVGHFMSFLERRLGMIPVGVDVSSQAIQAVRSHGWEAHHGDFCMWADGSQSADPFAMITAVSVLEHVIDPRLFFKNLYDRLEEGGVVYLQTPNVRSMVYRLAALMHPLAKKGLASVIESLYCSEHIQYVSRRGLRGLCRSMGFDVIAMDTAQLPIAEWPMNDSLVKSLTAALLKLDELVDERISLRILLRKPCADQAA